jgi:hypothetical protein
LGLSKTLRQGDLAAASSAEQTSVHIAANGRFEPILPKCHCAAKVGSS